MEVALLELSQVIYGVRDLDAATERMQATGLAELEDRLAIVERQPGLRSAAIRTDAGLLVLA